MRRIIILLVLAVLSAVPSAGAAAESKPRMPRSAADWATFSDMERTAAIDYVWRKLQYQFQSGTAVVTTVGRSDTGSIVEAAGPSAAMTTIDYNCPIQWIDLPEGTWTRGGGWTDSSSSLYYIAASRSGLQGQLLRDGALVGNWYEEAYNTSHSENWSGYNWKWWFEHFNFVNRGWHSARATSGGTWLLGPDQYCTVNVYR